MKIKVVWIGVYEKERYFCGVFLFSELFVGFSKENLNFLLENNSQLNFLMYIEILKVHKNKKKCKTG